MKVVVAIGGNALVTTTGDVTDQFKNSRVMAKPLADLVQNGWQVTVTHGNGPQVGAVIRRVEIASKQVYPIDLGLAVAATQGDMGYMVSQTWRNELHHRGIDRLPVAIITTVVVDANDPAFKQPSKPIGPFLDEAAAREHETRDGWKVVEDAGRGYRRIVASPKPLRVAEIRMIRELVQEGELIVAGGGGGIPIHVNERGEYHGILDAVIDKDRTSAIIAAEVEAEVLVLVTGVEFVFVNFGKPNQQALRQVNVAEVERHIADKQFPPGSMLPKVEAAIQFLKAAKAKNARAVITDLHNVPAALEGKTGTTITNA